MPFHPFVYNLVRQAKLAYECGNMSRSSLSHVRIIMKGDYHVIRSQRKGTRNG